MPVAVENEEGEKLLRDTWKLAGWWGRGDKCVHYFDYGDGFIGEYIYQNLPDCRL